MEFLKDKRVTVMGLGLHGGALGTIEWLLEEGAHVTVTDLKTETELAPTLEKLAGKNIRFVLGEHVEEDFTAADLVIRNPGAPKNSPYLEAARQAGVTIEMDSSLFFRNTVSQDIIGITGSKGKTSTAKAITAVLSHGEKPVVEVGTDGASPLGKLNDVTDDTSVVFELSSWRLESLPPHEISPRVAIVTSILRDHLNTYASLEEYADTKKSIIRFQNQDDIALLNWDDERLREWENDTVAHVFWYSSDPLPPNKKGICIENGTIVIRGNNQRTTVFQADVLPFTGLHQQRNLLPAIFLGAIYGIPVKTIRESIAAIQPLPHRLENIGTKDGVTFINDSAATMPDATIAALDTLKNNSIVLIIGGSDKKLEFDQLAEKIAQSNIRALIWLPGTATEMMRKHIDPITATPKVAAHDMSEAVTLATKQAKPGDVVLLSPGATSFGLFQHEFDRGDQFREAVLEK